MCLPTTGWDNWQKLIADMTRRQTICFEINKFMIIPATFFPPPLSLLLSLYPSYF